MSRTDVLTQDELLVAVRKLLEQTEHKSECSIDPDETHCDCLVGKVKESLPRCAYSITVESNSAPWRCVSIAHPDEPYKHCLEP